MPRRSMMDYLMGRPYGDMARGSGNYGDRASRDYGDYETDMARGRRSGRDGHHPMSQGSTYYPIEAMGTFNGYWGMPEEDYARGGRGRRDYGYDYNYDMRGRDYGYDYGDYGETLSKEELEHWNKKMLKDVDEKYKQHFKKENIAQKARTLGVSMEGFNEDELLTATIAMFTDYSDVLKPYVGESVDIYVKMAKAFLTDKDASVKGGEKLAVYHDCIVEGEDV